jgi:predicted DNA repair protein MutK
VLQILFLNEEKLENVVTFKPKNEQRQEEQKKSMIEVLDYMKQLVEDGIITEFVSCSIDNQGIGQVHASTLDVPGAIGMFEIGKHILISQTQDQD